MFLTTWVEHVQKPCLVGHPCGNVHETNIEANIYTIMLCWPDFLVVLDRGTIERLVAVGLLAEAYEA